MPPIIVYMPGKNLESLMPNVQAEQLGDFKQFQFPQIPVPLLAKEMGNFVAISPLAKALKTVSESRAPAGKALSATQTMVLGRSDVFINLNMKHLAPLYKKLMEKTIADMERQAQYDDDVKPMVGLLEWYNEFYGELLEEMKDVSMSVGLDEDAVRIEEVATYMAGGTISEMYTPARQVAPSELVAKLPDNDYILAVGGTEGSEVAEAQAMDLIDQGLKTLDSVRGELPFQLPENTNQRLRSIFKTYFEQVNGVHMVVGGAPQNNGLFNASFVLNVKDANAVQGMFTEMAGLVQDLIHAAGAEEPEVQQIKIAYNQAVETVDGVAVNAFAIQHPDLGKEDVQQPLTMTLGEGKIRFLTASPDNNTVVVTFGGSTQSVSSALTAMTQGGVNRAVGVEKALAPMPEKVSAVMVFSPANLIKVVSAGYQKMSPFGEFPFTFDAAEPLSMGISAGKSETHMVFRVPRAVIKETVEIVQQMEARQRPRRRGGGQAPPPGEDF
jgi:hypothetical protein